jgi:S1-C subfamily serine protease
MTKTLITMLLLLGLIPLAAAEPTAPADADELRADLEHARTELAEAAQRVASLTRQLSEQGLARRWAELDPEQWRGAVGDLPDGASIRRAITMAWSPRLGIVLGAEDEADGRLVRAVTPGGSAAAAGIEAGDRIIRFDDIEIDQQAAVQVRRILREREVGDTVILELERDGQGREVEIVLERPELPGLAMLRGDGQRFDFEGLNELLAGPMRPGRAAALGRQTQLAAIHPGLAPYFGTDSGVLVLRIAADNQLNLEAGDVILSIDGEAVSLPAELMRHLVRQIEQDTVDLTIMRRGARLDITGSLGADRPQELTRRRAQRG